MSSPKRASKATLKALQVRVNDDYAERVATHARSLDLSDAGLVKLALDEYLDRREADLESVKREAREKYEATLRDLEKLKSNPSAKVAGKKTDGDG
jgi:predicted transcriptional regulator